MTENEVAQIIKILDRIETEQAKQRQLLIGNGDSNAILPRIQALEYLVTIGKYLIPIITAVLIALLLNAVLGP